MARNSRGEEPESGGLAWLTLLVAIPAVALCCGGPLLLAAAGGALAAAAAWVQGYGGLALLSAAGVLVALGWARHRASAERGRGSQVAWRKGGGQ